MKSGKYTLKDLLVNKQIEQIIVPEIQRDYVWPKEQTLSFLSSLKRDFEEYATKQVPVESKDEEILKLFTDFYKRQKYASNIGFIYAYNDEEYSGKYFLIDGQQRLTTMYLLLLALAVKVEKQKDFSKFFFPNGLLKIDYKVRESAHDFIQNLFNYILQKGDIAKVSNQYWYFSDYDFDATIQSVIKNYVTISEFIAGEIENTNSFYDYVQNYVDCWYFDTSISEQGEELYIYMNARGEQIQNNEKDKAEALSVLRDEDLPTVSSREDFKEAKNLDGLKKYWGRKWEEWQDFFWLNRGKNENADNGFNNFLKCIQGLENYLANTDKYPVNNTVEKCSLEQIEIYIDALKFLSANKEDFKTKYTYSSWVDACIKPIWAILNAFDTDWLCNFTDNDRSKERRRMVFIWPFLLFYRQMQSKADVDEVFRLLRFFYLRYYNNNRSVTNIKSIVDGMLNNGVLKFAGSGIAESLTVGAGETDKKILTPEETSKYKFLWQKDKDLRQFESAIWKIEGHPLNRKGEDLGNINITHLIKFDAELTIEKLEFIDVRFRRIFPNELPFNGKQFQTLLLYYGKYWQKVKPNAYENYQFENWGRIVRNIDGDAFKKFFEEYCDTEEPVDFTTLLETKQLQFLNENLEKVFKLQELQQRLVVYSMLISDIWFYGNFIGIEPFYDEKLFLIEPSYTSKAKDFRSNYKRLFEMAGVNKSQAFQKLTKIKDDLTAKFNSQPAQ